MSAGTLFSVCIGGAIMQFWVVFAHHLRSQGAIHMNNRRTQAGELWFGFDIDGHPRKGVSRQWAPVTHLSDLQ